MVYRMTLPTKHVIGPGRSLTDPRLFEVKMIDDCGILVEIKISVNERVQFNNRMDRY